MNTRYTYHIRGVAENAWADQWYIGSRTATHGRTPEEDIGIHYFTSSSNNDFVAQFKAHPEWFVCTILERGYVSDVVMEEDEERRITESWNVLGRINRKGCLPLFERDEAFKANQAAANRKSAQNPVHRATIAAANRKRSQNPVWKVNVTAGSRKMRATPEYQETRRKMNARPEYKANQAAANRKRSQNPVWKANQAAANRKKAQDPVWKAKNAAANRKKAQDPEHQETMRKLRATPEWKAKNAAVCRKNAQDPEFGKKISDGMKRARALRDAAKTNTHTTDVLY